MSTNLYSNRDTVHVTQHSMKHCL